MFTTPTTSVTPASAPSRVRSVSSATVDTVPVEPKVPAQAVAAQAPAPPPPPAPGSQLKLVVAKADTSLAYSFTLVDQVTGRVVAEIPHQAVQAAAASPDYTAGAVIDTHA